MKDYTWKPAWSPVLNEGDIHPHTPEEKANLFEVADIGSTEYEVLNWIHASIRALKPDLVLETGAWEGMGTVALAHACKLNGFGKVHSLEHMPQSCVRLQQVLEEEHLLPWAEVHQTDSLEFLRTTGLVFDVGFFDSDTSVRADELALCLERGIIRKLAVLHDTAETRTELYTPKEDQRIYREKIFALTKHPMCSGYYESTLSRGFIALFLKG